MQTRGWLQKANYSRLRELEAPAFLLAIECVLHMNVVLRLPSLTSNDVHTAFCSHSPLLFACAPRSHNPDFILGLGLTVILL